MEAHGTRALEPASGYKGAMRLRLFAIACCGILCACDGPTAPPFPSDTYQQFQALPQYAYWWSLVEQCSGLTGDFSAAHWYETLMFPGVVDVGPPIADGVERYEGEWWRSGNRIVLSNPYDGQVARHEMLHALLVDGRHPLDQFAGKCDGVVAFDAPEDYGVPFPLIGSAPTVAAESALVVTITPDPATPHLSVNGGWFTYVVTATNVRGTPVWVPMANRLIDFVYLEDRLTGTYRDPPSARVFFMPGQQRRVTFDVPPLTPGVYHVVGGYAGAKSNAVTVTILP
jgi:hypothetical protein